MIITPDGPRGPAEVMPSGPVQLARARRRAGVPDRPGRAAGLTLKSWDQARIPLPFARGCVVLEGPLRVPADADAATLEGDPRRLAGAAARRPGPRRGPAGGDDRRARAAARRPSLTLYRAGRRPGLAAGAGAAEGARAARQGGSGAAGRAARPRHSAAAGGPPGLAARRQRRRGPLSAAADRRAAARAAGPRRAGHQRHARLGRGAGARGCRPARSTSMRRSTRPARSRRFLDHWRPGPRRLRRERAVAEPDPRRPGARRAAGPGVGADDRGERRGAGARGPRRRGAVLAGLRADPAQDDADARRAGDALGVRGRRPAEPKRGAPPLPVDAAELARPEGAWSARGRSSRGQHPRAARKSADRAFAAAALGPALAADPRAAPSRARRRDRRASWRRDRVARPLGRRADRRPGDAPSISPTPWASSACATAWPASR